MKKIGLITNHYDNDIADTQTNPVLLTPDYTHCAIIGETGCGKTTSAILPNLERRVKEGHGILVYDYKGNMHTKIKSIAMHHNRLDDITMIGVPWGKSINLIEDMTISEIETMLTQMMGHDDNNKYWERSGLDVGIPVLKLFRKIEIVKKAFAQLNISLSFDVKVRNNTISYDMPPTIASLASAISSVEDLKQFAQGYEDLSSSLIEQLKKQSHNIKNFQTLQYPYILFQELITLINEMKVIQKKYQIMPTDRHSTFSSIHISLLGVLTQISSNPLFNNSECDIAKLLDEGKIVIINTQSLSEMPLAFLTQSIFVSLKKRFTYAYKTPISIFIDEAQKVLNKEFELPIDTMREAQVDVFLAFQNPSLIVSKIGKDAYKSLHTNLTKKFVYRSDTIFDDKADSSDFKSFEYCSNRDEYLQRYIATPLFITAEEEFEAEFEYQKLFDTQSYFVPHIPYPDECVIVYDSRLFEENKLVIRTREGTSIECGFSQQKAVHECEFFFGNLFGESLNDVEDEDDELTNCLNEILGQ